MSKPFLVHRVTPIRASGFQEELPITLHLSLTSHPIETVLTIYSNWFTVTAISNRDTMNLSTEITL